MSTITQTTTTLPTGTWQADAAHSRIEFDIDYLAGKFRGSFSPFTATLEVDEAGKATLTGSARAADVKVQDENLVGHLQSPDFFDAERAPEITFRSDRIDVGDGQVTVAGELTLAGTTKPVELRGALSGQLTDYAGRERVNLRLEGALDRTGFGVDWNMDLPSGEPALSNEVRLSAELYFVKA
jgi:polyisoprenoid-binding protein YceI